MDSFVVSAFSDAVLTLSMKHALGEQNYPVEWRQSGVLSFEKLDGEAYEASVTRDSDGYVLHLKEGWLSLNQYRARRLRPTDNRLTLYYRVHLNDGGCGALFCSDFLSLVLHHTGLLIAFVGTKIPTGKTFREMPIGFLRQRGWLDLVLRLGDGRLEVFCNGALLNAVPFPHPLCAPFDDDMLIGAFQSCKPDTYDVVWPFDPLRDSRVDTVSLWHSCLSDERVARLSGCKTLDSTLPMDDLSQAFRAYNALFDGSVLKDAAARREAVAVMERVARKDPARPVHHLTQPVGCLYDPCGAFYHNGQYHVYSYRNIVYLLQHASLDHYVSDDLVTWRQEAVGPFADAEPDVFCIYLMNHFIDDTGRVRALYTGQGLNGKTGVLADVDEEMLVYDNKRSVITAYHHDGHVWKHGEKWYTITSKLCRGTREGDRGNPVMMWSSDDLLHWTEEGEIFTQRKDEHNPEGFMEFPYLLSFGEKDVLMLGGHPVKYWVGRFDWDTLKFEADHRDGVLLDLSNPFHCFNPLCVDNKGENGAPRRLMMALYRDLAAMSDRHVPWLGTHVTPRVLSLEEGHLRQDPVPEVAAHRCGEAISVESIAVRPDTPVKLPMDTTCAELSVVFRPGKSGRVGVRLYVPEDNGPAVSVCYDAADGTFGVAGEVKTTGRGPAYVKQGEDVKLHIFMDRGFLEVFVNGQSCTTSTKTTIPAGAGIWLFAEEMEGQCVRADLWSTEPIK